MKTMSYSGSEYIDRYIRLVESGTVPVCIEQIQLVEMVKRIFAEEDITIDHEQLETYMGYQKYFPFKFVEWEDFCFALHI